MRKIVVNAPTNAGTPDFEIRVAKNRLVVAFSRNCDSALQVESCRGKIYTVVDVTTGQKLAEYEAAKEEVSGPIACYAPDPDRFFTFWIPSDQHHLEIVEASPK
jgi:hypothetical protein